MAFISFTYNRYDPATKQYLYTLVDSDFGEVEVGVVVWGGVGGIAVAKEYSKRGLPVGKNLALLVLYMHKERGYNISDVKYWQDTHCPKYMENGPEGTASGAKRWEMYAQERDYHLNKLLALL